MKMYIGQDIKNYKKFRLFPVGFLIYFINQLLQIRVHNYFVRSTVSVASTYNDHF